MLKMKEQKGFTLVELAIVLVIVGLLIGGILKGQELMHNARVTATVSQIKSYEAAVTNFYDMYKEKPGDLYDPATRIKDCAKCTPGTGGEMGNGKVGLAGWDMSVTNQSVPVSIKASSDTALTGNSAVYSETVLFWYELLVTGLISGVTSEGVESTGTASIGGTIPGMSVGGGLMVGNANGTGIATPADLGKDELGVRGTILVAVNKADVLPSTTAGSQIFYPKDAANIDRKLDDGLPNSGNVESYGGQGGANGTCTNGTDNSSIYSENTNSKDCGLIMRIFK